MKKFESSTKRTISFLSFAMLIGLFGSVMPNAAFAGEAQPGSPYCVTAYVVGNLLVLAQSAGKAMNPPLSSNKMSDLKNNVSLAVQLFNDSGCNAYGSSIASSLPYTNVAPNDACSSQATALFYLNAASENLAPLVGSSNNNSAENNDINAQVAAITTSEDDLLKARPNCQGIPTLQR